MHPFNIIRIYHYIQQAGLMHYAHTLSIYIYICCRVNICEMVWVILNFQFQDASEGDVLSSHPVHCQPGLHDYYQ